jgi:hypothetical protein
MSLFADRPGMEFGHEARQRENLRRAFPNR